MKKGKVATRKFMSRAERLKMLEEAFSREGYTDDEIETLCKDLLGDVLHVIRRDMVITSARRGGNPEVHMVCFSDRD